MCVFVTVKNVVHDSDKDLAQARSLSLSLSQQFVCVSRSSTIMTLERKFIQQLCRNQTGFPRVQDCTCQSSIPDDDAFPYGTWSPTSRYDHQKQKTKNKKRIHRSFKPCIENFSKKDKSVRVEEQQQQCTGRKKEIALAHRLDLILHDPAWERNLVDPNRLDLCIMYVMY
jgi:hypothetical protein